METTTPRILVVKADYDVMSSYIKGRSGTGKFDGENANKLLLELKRATVVDDAIFPNKVVRLNSRVLVKDLASGKLFDITLVTPEKADIKSGKVSFMAPLGVALIGYEEGDTIKWSVPSGNKLFKLLEVRN